MATRTEIRDWVRQQTLVETDDFADAKVDAIINQAIRDVSVRFRWPYLAKKDTVAFVADQQAYALPADLATIEKIVVTGESDPLHEVGTSLALERKGDDFGSALKPTHFFVWGNSIYLMPVPSVSSGSVTLYYYRQPVVLAADGESPEFASEFHMILADYVASRVWKREEDFEKADEYQKAYLDGLENMARYYLQRAADVPLVLGDGDREVGNRWPNMPWLDTV